MGGYISDTWDRERITIEIISELLQMSEEKTAQLKNRKYKNMKAIWPISMQKDSSAFLMIRKKKLKQKWASISHSSIWGNFKLCVCVCMNVFVWLSVSTRL